jgi:hypothetical protein
MHDLMWALPDGTRRLVAPDPQVAGFVSSLYRFEDVLVTPMRLTAGPRLLELEVPGLGLSLTLRAGRAMPFPLTRPASVTRRLESPVARRLLGVRTWGVGPGGAEQWYQVRSVRWVAAGSAHLRGEDLGPLGRVEPPVSFGFTEPPRRPSMVGVRSLLRLPA